jgi:O-antigen ligase
MSAVHQAILVLVWLAFAVSGIVFTEPAPVDLMLIGLVALLPACGLVAITPTLALYIALWSIAAACGFLAATQSHDTAGSTIFTAISLYLYIASFVLAAFIARAPARHCELIFNGWLFAATLAAAAAFIGYFKLVPGTYELFTRFDRATGPFKDPNVFGPFLVAPFLYALHLALTRSWQVAAAALAVAGTLALAVLLSFSRGAWLNLLVALGIYGVLAFATARTQARRNRIIGLVLVGAGLVALVTLAVLQDDKLGGFLSERSSMTQSYDVGPAGRFGGQEKAVRLLLEHPLGIGAGEFTSVHHTEEVHNVFLSMFLNAGWLGGMTYWLMAGLTLLVGFRHVMSPSAARPLFLIAFSAFIATALEGVIIDSDHWRSFYVLMAMVWGLGSSPYHEPDPAETAGQQA